MSFKRIQIKKKSTQVAEQIIESIRKGVYKVGDKLPPEREIVEKTGVSRPSVREALLALQIVEIIESRAGDGTYVRQGVENLGVKSRVLSMLEKNEDPFEALEARKILEEGVARVAAQKATPKDLEKIKEALERGIEAEKNQNYESFEETDRDFHLAIIKSCKNSLIEDAIHPFVDVMKQELWRNMKQRWLNKEQIKVTIDEHQRIFIALRKKDGEIASKEMVKHLDNSEKRFFWGRDQKNSRKEAKK